MIEATSPEYPGQLGKARMEYDKLGKTFAGLGSVLGGEVLLRLASFGTLVVLARLYGASTLGTYASWIAMATIVTMIADNGFQVIAVSETGRTPLRVHELVTSLFLLKGALLIPAAALLVCAGAILKLSPELYSFAFLVSARVILQSICQLELAFLKALGRSVLIGPIQFAHFLFLSTGLFFAYTRSAPIGLLLTWMVAGQVLEMVLSGVALLRAGVRPRPTSLPALWDQLRRSTPLGLTNSLANLVIRLDVLVLALLVSAEELGQFSAANALLVMVYVTGWLFGSVLLPELSKRANSAADLDAYVSKWSRIIGALAIPAAAVLYWVSPWVLIGLYGSTFSSAGRYSSVMLLSAPLILLNVLYTNRAIAQGRLRLFLGASVVAVIFALGMNLALGWSYGAMGISGGIVLREAGVFLFLRMGQAGIGV